jgi:membrane protease YdiL (CAAX protease family)
MTAMRTAMPYWLGYALLWGLSLLYLGLTGADWIFPIAVMVIFGGFASGVAWLLTRRSNAPEVPVNRPGIELSVTLLFLLVYALAFLGWGLGAVREAVAEGAGQDLLVLGVKLIVHVAIPAALLLLVGGAVRPLFDSGLGRPGFWPTLIVIGLMFLALLAVVSPSLRNIGALDPPTTTLLWAAPAFYVLISLEAGLCEEFLYRAVLQSRLAAVLRTASGAIPVASILFALAHVPGLYLRGGPGVDGWSTDPLQVAAFTIATLSPLSLFFGFLWWRTRSLLLIVLLHGAIDVLPNLPEFLTHFAL